MILPLDLPTLEVFQLHSPDVHRILLIKLQIFSVALILQLDLMPCYQVTDVGFYGQLHYVNIIISPDCAKMLMHSGISEHLQLQWATASEMIFYAPNALVERILWLIHLELQDTKKIV
jgi:hypothetical protein